LRVAGRKSFELDYSHFECCWHGERHCHLLSRAEREWLFAQGKDNDQGADLLRKAKGELIKLSCRC
jgi:hypothetical protein